MWREGKWGRRRGRIRADFFEKETVGVIGSNTIDRLQAYFRSQQHKEPISFEGEWARSLPRSNVSSSSKSKCDDQGPASWKIGKRQKDRWADKHCWKDQGRKWKAKESERREDGRETCTNIQVRTYIRGEIKWAAESTGEERQRNKGDERKLWDRKAEYHWKLQVGNEKCPRTTKVGARRQGFED